MRLHLNLCRGIHQALCVIYGTLMQQAPGTPFAAEPIDGGCVFELIYPRLLCLSSFPQEVAPQIDPTD